MSWCDRLASVPTVGFRLTNHFAPIDVLLDSLSPILDRVPEDQTKNVAVEQSTTNFSSTFVLNDGFKYSATEAQISVAFQHRMRYRHTSGGSPVMEMLSKPMPFTSLLPEVSKRLVEATLLLPKASERQVTRVGFVSTTPIGEEDLPPGIKRMIDYIGRPWKGMFDAYNLNLTMQLNKTAEILDRCTHALVKHEDKDQLLTLQFDWQRRFNTGWAVTHSNLVRILGDAEKDALKYFEDLAEGSRFDEVLLRETVGA
jgi:hypothetical protein